MLSRLKSFAILDSRPLKFYATGMDLFTFAELKFKPGIVLVERSDSGVR